MKSFIAGFDSLIDQRGNIRALCLLRALLGPVVLLHLAPFVADMIDGVYYADSFYTPWFSWLDAPPRALYFALLCLAMAAALLMTVGLFARPASVFAFGFIAYNFFLSEIHFRHNRNFLLAVMFGLTLLPVGRAVSIDAVRAFRRTGVPPSEDALLWPVFLMRVLGVAPYLGSGVSKLLDTDWWSGLVLYDRVIRFRHHLDNSIAPSWVADLVTSREFHLWFAKLAIFTELFLVVALWPRRTRYAAVWVAIAFHLSIEVSARVQVFSWLAISATLIWVVPRARDRVLELRRDRASARALRVLVRRLDWLARFQVREVDSGPAIAVLDRDGRRFEGPRAARLVLSRLPILAFFVLPTLFPGIAWVCDRLTRQLSGRSIPRAPTPSTP